MSSKASVYSLELRVSTRSLLKYTIKNAAFGIGKGIMAKVFPKELPYGVRRNPRSRAELRVYDALKSQLGKDWTVFYNVAWLGLTHPNDAPRDGETDFIIAHPEHGILCCLK